MKNKEIIKDPESIKIQSSLFKEGIQYSIIMTNNSYSKLVDDLLILSNNDYTRRKFGNEVLPKTELYNREINALMNAWQIVDSVNRLRELLRYAPSMNHDEEWEVFLKQTENVEYLRDNMQHLDKQIKEFIQRKIPAWGNLSWVAKFDNSSDFFVYGLVPGTIFEREDALINPAGRKAKIPIGIITLISDKNICLSELVDIHLKRVTKWLQNTYDINFSKPAKSMLTSVVFSLDKTISKDLNK
jgi:hypothetical protein